MSQPTIRNLQVLRGIACLGVVLYHFRLWEGKALGAASQIPSYFSIGDAGLDVFFALSGFIMVYIQPAPFFSVRQGARFLLHRYARIYVPYWAVLIPLITVWWFAPQLFNNYYRNQVDIPRSIFLLPQSFTPLLSVAWTLVFETYFYLVVTVAFFLPEKSRGWFAGLWVASICVAQIWDRGRGFSEDHVLQLIFSPFNLTFIGGFLTGLARPVLHRFPQKWWLLVGLGGVTAANVGYRWKGDSGVYPDNNEITRFFAYGIPAVLLLAAAVALERPGASRRRALEWLGDSSYSVYLVHLPLVSAFYVGLSKIEHPSPWLVCFGSAVCLASCLILGGVFHHSIEIPIVRRFRYLIDKSFPREEKLA